MKNTVDVAFQPAEEPVCSGTLFAKFKEAGGAMGHSSIAPVSSAPSPTFRVTDETAPDVAVALLVDFSPGVDPRVAALCRWVLGANVAELRRELEISRTATVRAQEDFHRMRALHNDRSLLEIDDTIDENLPEAQGCEAPEAEADGLTLDRSGGRRTVRLQRSSPLATLYVED